MKSVLTIILLMVFFVNPLAAQELSGTLNQIQKTGKIKIGYRQFRPPMSYMNKDGKPEGYSVDICRHIVTEISTRMGVDVNIEYVPLTAENRFAAL